MEIPKAQPCCSQENAAHRARRKQDMTHHGLSLAGHTGSDVAPSDPSSKTWELWVLNAESSGISLKVLDCSCKSKCPLLTLLMCDFYTVVSIMGPKFLQLMKP